MTSNLHGSALSELLANFQELPEYLGTVLSDVNQRSSFGDFPLSVAAVRGDVAAIQTLIAAGAQLNAKGEHGYTALHSAVEQGHRDAVDCLLAFGADKTIHTDKGLTPLDLADLLDESTIAERLKAAS
jgi:ankyrin repeat protein